MASAERPAGLSEADAEDRRGQAADRADRQVDLAEQQHQDDAERDRARRPRSAG